ncbi:MAG TPA: hypothetical protein PLW55_09610, partial [Leptospiraceae bacterium]|nr:hypothetical protein [Leptospiraceae bacterium]
MHNTLEQILRQREVRGERTVALLRAAFISLAVFLDVLAFAHVIPPYTSSPPAVSTLLLDAFFLSAALAFAILALKGVYYGFLKFVTITLDYVLILVMFAFDPSLAGAGIENLWLAVIAPVFMLYLNLIRFSQSAAWYAAGLSVAQCAIVARLILGSWELQKILPLEFGLLMLISIGLAVSAAGRQMT